MKVAVDFGSTISVLGWKDGNKMSLFRYPTVIIEGDNQYPDVFGDDAMTYQQNTKNTANLVVETGFKQKLLFPKAEDEYPRGYELSLKFFRFLYDEFDKNAPLLKKDRNNMEFLLTVPLGVGPDRINTLKEIAEEVGFSKANGFSSVTVINEARCLTELAFSLADQELNLYLQEMASGRKKKGLALFGDIGGLTGDFNLVDISFDAKNNRFHLEEIPMPRKISDGSDLGGIQLDKALLQYLVNQGFINRANANNWVKTRGYSLIQKFKEDANENFWKNGNTPNDLGALPFYLNGNAPDGLKDFQNHKGCLAPEKFVKTAAKNYINTLSARLNSLFAATGKKKEDVDWIFLTGGGSQIFFMDSMIRVMWKKEELQAPRILKGSSPTESCVQGALTENDYIKMLLASNDTYCVYVDVNIHGLIGIKEKRQIKIDLVEAGQQYPVHVEGSETISFEMSAGVTGISFNVTPYAVSANKKGTSMGNLDKTKAANAESAKMGKTKAAMVKDGAKVAGTGAFALLCLGAGVVVSGFFGDSGQGKAIAVKGIQAVQESTKDFRDDYLSTNYIERLKLDYVFDIDGNGCLTGSVKGNSDALYAAGTEMNLVIG